MSSMTSQLLSEFIGTFLLVLTIGCNVLSKSGDWQGVSIACVLMVMIYSFGGISGANFNPAVSLSLGMTKSLGGTGLDWKCVGMYSIVQIIAGILAGFCYFAIFGVAFNLGPERHFNFLSAGACELLYTFMLCFVVLNVAVAKTTTPNQYYGLAIGFVIVAGAYGAGAVSGGCFNPAVACGIDVSSFRMGFGWCFAYTGVELVGAILAAFLFKVVRPCEFGGDAEAEVTILSKLTSEFLGTFMLVLTVGLNVLGESAAGAFSIAASLMCMIYALGDISGAHFNPAVTLAVFSSRLVPEFSLKDVVLYMVTQILGGISGAFTYSAIHSGRSFPLGPKNEYTWMQVSVAESVFTSVLCLVVLCTAVAPKTSSSSMFGLAIGSCVTVGGFAIGGISGGSLNPAVSFGINAVELSKGGRFFNALIYSGLEFAGALVASVVVSLSHAEKQDELKHLV